MAAQLAPFGRCEFLKTVFQPMYMPLCIDSVNGFGLATVSSGMGGAVMLIMLFFAVVARPEQIPRPAICGSCTLNATGRLRVTLSLR